MKLFIRVLAAIILVVGSFQVASAAGVVLPKGYEKWEKSKEKVVTDKSSLFYGVHYLYVDKKAMATYRNGGKYPEGSQFVVDYYNIREEGGKPVKGKKNMVVLMKKDKKQKTTGGWLFAGFTPDGKHNKSLDPVKNCFECHAKDAAATDYVISRYSDFK